MRQPWKLGLWIALVVFGAAATTRQGYAASAFCSGREILCYTDETETCLRRSICGVRLPNGIISCCAEKETIVDYFYFQ